MVEMIPTLEDLKNQDTANHLTMLAAEPFAELAQDISCLDEIIPVNLADYMLLREGDTLLDRFRNMDQFAKRLHDADYNMVLNFTHTKTSAALCRLLDVEDTRGVTLDKRGFQLVRNPWLFYFFVSNLNRPFNQFNLVDVLRRSVGISPEPGKLKLESSAEGEQEAEQLWQQFRIPRDRPVIGLAVGASNHTKQWLPEYFARMTESVHESLHAHFVILGGKDEQETARRITQGRSEYITDCTTRTSLRGLGPALKRCDLLVSNDTGTMHVAAAVGTPTVSLVMGTALGSETAPYHTLGLVMQSLHECTPCGYKDMCRDAQCRKDITPEAVTQCVEMLLQTSDLSKLVIPDSPDFSQTQVYRGDFDQDGLFDLYPLIQRELDKNSLTDRILRRIWLEFLESPPWEVLGNGGIDHWVDWIVDYCRIHFDISHIEKLLLEYQDIEKAQLLKPLPILERGIQTAGDLITAVGIQPLNVDKITQLGNQLAQIDQQLESVGHTQQMLRAFHIYFNLRKGSLSADDLTGQAQETLEIYRGYKLQLLLADRMVEGVLTKLSQSPTPPQIITSNIDTVTPAQEQPLYNKEKVDWESTVDSQGWEHSKHQLIGGMNLRIPIPEEITTHQVKDKHLVIAPEKAAWVVTDSQGVKVLQSLQAGKTVGESIVELVEGAGISPDQAAEHAKTLIEDINKQGFRTDISPIETTLEDNPPLLQLFLTRKCNLRCTHCYVSAGNALDQELDTRDWIDIIDQFSAMNAGDVVTFSGGEPLVHPQFDDIARQVKQAGHKVYLLTNGIAVDRERAQSLVGVVDTVQLSLEGTNPDTHDFIRGNGSYQRAINGLKSLLDCKFPVEVVFVVLPGNVTDLRDNLGDFVEGFGTSNLTVALGVVNFVGRAEDGLEDPPESLVGHVVDAYPDVQWLRRGSWVSNRIVRGCPLANSVVIDADGRITTCPYLHYLSPHNIRYTALSDASSLDRAWHAQTIRLSPKCRDCDLRNFPCGGCMVRQTECSNQVFQRAYYRMLHGR